MKGGVIYYALSPSNKKYYGYSTNFKGRKNGHLQSVKKGIISRFYDAIRKYGWNNFKWQIVEEYKKYDKITLSKILCEREVYWIAKDKTYLREYGYNMTKGGDGRVGIPHSEETKQKIGKAGKGRTCSEETRRKMSEAHKGKKLSKKHKKKLSDAFLGKTWEEILGIEKSIIRRKKSSNSMKGKNIGFKNGMYGKIPWNKGISPSEETRKKISEAIKGQKRPKDKKYRKRISEGLKMYYKNKK